VERKRTQGKKGSEGHEKERRSMQERMGLGYGSRAHTRLVPPRVSLPHCLYLCGFSLERGFSTEPLRGSEDRGKDGTTLCCQERVERKRTQGKKGSEGHEKERRSMQDGGKRNARWEGEMGIE
jgi:hypothetical protein